MVVNFWESFFQLNFVPFTAIVFLLIFVWQNDSYERRITLLFRNAILFLFGLLVIDNVDLYNIYHHVGSVYKSISVAIGCIIRLCVLLCVVSIMLRRNYKSFRLKVFLTTPLVLTILSCIGIFTTNLVFWYDENGDIHYGPFFYVQYVACIIYGLFMIYYAVKRLDRHSRRSESMILIASVCLMFIGVTINTIWNTRGLVTSLVSMVLIFYYLYISITYLKMDDLTGVYNKSSFKADRKRYEDNITALVSLNLNDLHVINDEEGYEAGNRALKSTSKIVESVLPNNCNLYRIGGDTFFIMCLDMSEDDVCDLLIKIRNAIAETPYSLSSGFAMATDEHDLDEVYAEADANMYNEKSLIKSRRRFITVE